MTDPHRLHAVERAISTIIEQFERFPDLFHRESDLHSGFCRILQSAPLLAEVYLTRDGRHTGLVHREYPAFFSCDAPAGLGSSGGRFDVAVLAPGFVRGHCLEVVANLEGRAGPLKAGAIAIHRIVQYLYWLPSISSCFPPLSPSYLEE